jgi:hypothetical protein
MPPVRVCARGTARLAACWRTAAVPGLKPANLLRLLSESDRDRRLGFGQTVALPCLLLCDLSVRNPG